MIENRLFLLSGCWCRPQRSAESVFTPPSCCPPQYTGEPGSRGSARFVYSRVADIAIGVAICIVLSFIKPW